MQPDLLFSAANEQNYADHQHCHPEQTERRLRGYGIRQQHGHHRADDVEQHVQQHRGAQQSGAVVRVGQQQTERKGVEKLLQIGVIQAEQQRRNEGARLLPVPRETAGQQAAEHHKPIQMGQPFITKHIHIPFPRDTLFTTSINAAA